MRRSESIIAKVLVLVACLGLPSCGMVIYKGGVAPTARDCVYEAYWVGLIDQDTALRWAPNVYEYFGGN